MASQHLNKNIVLIGMPGVGKSTVGVLLAKRLGFSFMDTDIYIQSQESKSLQELIRQYGTSGFCDLEARYMTSISVRAHVLATGGSVIYRPKAMQHLKTNGVVIHLDIELDRLKKRLDDLDARGVVIAPGVTLDALFAERQPLYAKYADVILKTDGLTADRVVRKLVAQLSP
jgi:shikimate kinase